MENKMIKWGIFISICGLCSFLSIIFIVSDTGTVIFDKELSVDSFYQDNKMGPIQLTNENRYGLAIKAEFADRLHVDYRVKIIDDENRNVWLKESYIKGRTKGCNGVSTDLYTPIEVNRTGDYFILFQPISNRYNCPINKISIELKENTLKVPSVTLSIAGLIIVSGLVLFYFGVRGRIKNGHITD